MRFRFISVVRVGDTVHNALKKRERFGRPGCTRTTERNWAGFTDIVAGWGLRIQLPATPGDEREPLFWNAWSSGASHIGCGRAQSKNDEDRLTVSLAKLAERPNVQVRTDSEMVRLISGMGELHLEVIVDRLL